MKKFKKLTHQDIELLKDLYLNGMSIPQLGKLFDIDPSNIHRRIQLLGLKFSRPSNKEIIEMYNENRRNLYEKIIKKHKGGKKMSAVWLKNDRSKIDSISKILRK